MFTISHCLVTYSRKFSRTDSYASVWRLKGVICNHIVKLSHHVYYSVLRITARSGAISIVEFCDIHALITRLPIEKGRCNH